MFFDLIILSDKQNFSFFKNINNVINSIGKYSFSGKIIANYVYVIIYRGGTQRCGLKIQMDLL